MPNASQAHRLPGEKILVLGDTGCGKTTQLLTFPGKKFAYLFDPNALNSLIGYDIEYEEFLPDLLDLKVYSLSKDANKRAGLHPSKEGKEAGNLYLEWEKDFETKLADGYFDPFDVIALDSMTTFSDCVMDRVLAINNRGGMWPTQDDYGPQMSAISKVVRTFTSMGKTVYFTGHVEMKQDDLTKKIFRSPLFTGRLKAKLPLLFSEIYFMFADVSAKGGVKYTLQTKPDRMTPLIRCTIPGLEPFEDVTLDFSKPLEAQGVGAILARRKD